MTFLTILGVTEILYNFRLIIEEKTSKEIPESSNIVNTIWSSSSKDAFKHGHFTFTFLYYY